MIFIVKNCGYLLFVCFSVFLPYDAGTNGEVTFSNVPNGTHRLRVVAGVNEEAIRSRVIIMPGNSDFCSLNAINEGTTVEYKSNATAHVTFEFRPIGRDVGFMCKIDNGPEFFLCT